ncbi:MAG TPA: YicC/YloC family endoribonuclease [Xanthobacteraceae bacterium]|nr:YicC/YloC family endoribonuclease [Xanthobacteraceae bacterium]
MALSSMTGFARSHGISGPYGWTWEIKSVNGKGLDLRLRFPAGWDAIEVPVRTRAAEALGRGSVQANLTVERSGAQPVVRVNAAVLDALLATIRQIAPQIDAAPPSLDGLLALKGVIDVTESGESEEARRAAEAAVIAGFGEVVGALGAMRRHEGEALGRVLAARLGEIAALAERAERAPGRRPEAIRARLAEQIAALLEQSERFDPDRLHQEAIMIASKADVREELDRLAAHVAQAQHLIGQGGAIGRRLDFLAQELNREANTLCAKANDLELTNIGLELKAAVEQFREQVQNVE